MKNSNEVENIYYIEAAKESSTRIGKTMIMPGKAPTPFTEKQYKANQRQIGHYERKGTIMVAVPNTKKAVVAARKAKAELEALEKTVSKGSLPPPPMVRQMGQPAQEPVAVPPMPTFSTPDEGDNPDSRCVAVTAKGTRCKGDSLPDVVVCKIHAGMLKRGKEVMSYDGRTIADDGKSYA